MTSKWNDERLDRLANMVEANQLQIEANSRDIAANSRDIAANSRDIAANTQAINQLVNVIQSQQSSTDRLFEANTKVLQMIVQEIRGLRAENRRILTHLFGEQQPE